MDGNCLCCCSKRCSYIRKKWNRFGWWWCCFCATTSFSSRKRGLSHRYHQVQKNTCTHNICERVHQLHGRDVRGGGRRDRVYQLHVGDIRSDFRVDRVCKLHGRDVFVGGGERVCFMPRGDDLSERGLKHKCVCIRGLPRGFHWA